MRRRLLSAVSWLAVVAALLPVPVAAQDPCEDQGNLTFNCQFDTFAEAPGGQVAQGWWPFVVSGHPAFDQSTESPKAPAQRIWSDGEGFVAGIYQIVNGVTPGATYQAYVGWFVFQSSGPEMGRAIGIDPAGGTDPNSPAIVWSPEVWEKKRLAPELVARAVAQASQVTLFLRVNHPKTYGADQAFLDAASLVLDAAVPVLDVLPTATPLAEPTGTPMPAPVATEPTATDAPPTAEPAPPAATATPADLAPTATSATATASTPAATAIATASPTPPPTVTATAGHTLPAPPTATALPAATAWDVRGGTTVAELAFAPAAAAHAPRDDGAAVAPARHVSFLPPLLAAIALIFVVAYVLVRTRAGGRDHA